MKGKVKRFVEGLVGFVVIIFVIMVIAAIVTPSSSKKTADKNKTNTVVNTKPTKGDYDLMEQVNNVIIGIGSPLIENTDTMATATDVVNIGIKNIEKKYAIAENISIPKYRKEYRDRASNALKQVKKVVSIVEHPDVYSQSEREAELKELKKIVDQAKTDNNSIAKKLSE